MPRMPLLTYLVALAAFSAGVATSRLLFVPELNTPRASLWDAEGRYGPCEVSGVIDGDTIDVVCGRIPHRVRLLNVDTPERREPGYEQAREALARLIDGREVYLLFEEPGKPTLGRYGRLLAYVLSDSGSNLNLEMIRGGWSPFYRKYGDGRFAESFAQAEKEARRRHKGLAAIRP